MKSKGPGFLPALSSDSQLPDDSQSQARLSYPVFGSENQLRLFRLLGGLLDLLGQLLELLGERRAEALDRRLDAVDPELRGQLVFVEQVVVARRLDRHRGLEAPSDDD